MLQRILLRYYYCRIFFFFREESRDIENKVGRQFRPLYDIPYLFEAREFLRKRLVGKKVQVCSSIKYSIHETKLTTAKSHLQI